jgi:AraC family transcriptional regulator, ethanolamine operon transcriptional activator
MQKRILRSFDEYEAAVRHADIRVTISQRQQTYWALEHLSLGDVSLQWGQAAGPNVVEGTSQAGGLNLFLPQFNSDSIVGNGHRMKQGTLMLIEGGSEFCLASTSHNRWSSIYIPLDQFTAHGIPELTTLRKHSVMAPTGATRRLRGMVETLGTVSASASDGLWKKSAVKTIRHKIAKAIGEAIGLSKADAVHGRSPFSRSQIAHRALQIVEEYSEPQISVDTLANKVGISERTLRAAFGEYFGIAPNRYLKLRTLHQARRRLKDSDPQETTVTEIALGLGIWELGRFSSDYKQLFDELPSQTLKNGFLE